jgi:hypothetical protein
VTSNEGLDDPLLKELLTAFREDSIHLANDILSGLWLQFAVALVALFLAVSETIRLLVYYLNPFAGPGFGPRPITFVGGQLFTEITLTSVLFVLSVLSLRYSLLLRRRYSRLAALAEKLGR